MKVALRIDKPCAPATLADELARIAGLAAAGYTSGVIFADFDEAQGWWEIDPPFDLDRDLVLDALNERLKYCERRVRDCVEPDTLAHWSALVGRLRAEIEKVKGAQE